MDHFNDVAAHLRPVEVKAYEVHAGDWLDTRCNNNIEERERLVSRIFAVERCNAFAVVLHREGQRALTVPTRLPLVVWRRIEELRSEPVCRCVAGTRDVCRACHPEPRCQCSRWHTCCCCSRTGYEERILSLEAEVVERERTIRSLRDDLMLRTGERDHARRALDRATERVRKAREALL